MALVPGTRLGAYEVLTLIGSGGMGEVYRARDTRLDRTVAVKVLPATLAADPQFRERFDREAHTISQLDHPHICSLYDVGEQHGTAYLVMQYLEGVTLADRIAKGSLPIDEALRIAIQIADALDAAHRHSIVHRDLKPGNVMLTRAGAKLLDFGLAKASEPAIAAAGLSMLPTTPPNLTAQGAILGTFQYMAPEQLEGQEADARTDIFAFGAVVYEMLTGKKAFEGKSQASLIGAIMHADPTPISILQPLTPPTMDRIVKKCLAKEPEARWHSAHDLHDELVWVASDTVTATPKATSHVRRRERVAWLVAAVALLAVVALIGFEFRRAVPELSITRLDVATLPTSDPMSFALSPDGRQLVFVATADGASKLWLRPLDQTMARPLAGTDGASYPFWAPDSRVLGFFADGKLKRLDLSGGLPQVLADVAPGRGGSWSRDGILVFAPSTTGPLLRVDASGGPPVAIMRPEQTRHQSSRWPQMLPDGRVLFFATNGPDPSGVYLGSLDGSVPTRLLSADTAAAYAPPGYLLVVDQGVLLARRLDLERGTLGDPVAIAQPVGTDPNVNRGAFAVSATGVLSYRSGTAVRRQLVWLDRRGTRVGAVGAPDENALINPALAPDGRRVAVTRIVQGNLDIWLYNSRDVATRFTFDPATDTWPVWSPDGRHLAFASNRNGQSDLYRKPASGSGIEQVMLATAEYKVPLDWSRDGRFLLYGTQNPKTASDLWALQLTGERTSIPIARTPFDERHGQFAPDGRWVAFDSNESGRVEVYLQPFPGPGEKVQVSAGGGTGPRWRGDGEELFYLAPDGAVMAASVRASSDGQTLEPGASVRLFRAPIAYGGSVPGPNFGPQYAVAPDGQRFLINVTTDDAITVPITIVQNWTAALKK